MDKLPGGTVSALMDEGNWDVIRENFLATYNGNRRPFGLFCASRPCAFPHPHSKSLVPNCSHGAA